MMEQENPRVLCVDDEPEILTGLMRTLFEDFDVTTATSGAEALDLINEDGPFAVVVSDMRMPEMSGAEFLHAARVTAPESVRILLTGQSDLESAVSAINHGSIFRFLSKPCEAPLLINTLKEAAEHHRLLKLEKTLLAGTLGGAVKTMVKLLEIVAPSAFKKSSAMHELVAHTCKINTYEDAWLYETAALLCQAGHVVLPTETLDKVDLGHELTAEEEQMVASAYETAVSLVGEIPRLERVAEIIAAFGRRDPRPTGTPNDAVVARGAQLLIAADHANSALRAGKEITRALLGLHTIDKQIKGGMATFRASHRATHHALRLEDCRLGMVLNQDVVTKQGLRLAARTPNSIWRSSSD